MQDVQVEFDGVWKRFKKGERARSLRDAIPWMTRQILRRQPQTNARPSREFYSLKDVSFQVRAGECLGIIGPNGAGKSTLLKCATRILRPNQGHVRVKGRVSALIEVGAGFHPDLTGRENIFLNGTILGMSRREVTDCFDAIVDFSGMAKFIDTPVKRYSSGMFARLGFSVAAFMNPDVLLIDEALSVGDMNFARKCEKKIKDILDSETTVIFISHHLSAVRMICDRALLLSGGSITFEGSPDETIQAYHELLNQEHNSGQLDSSIRSFTLSMADEVGAPTMSASPGQVITLDAQLTVNQDIHEAGIGFFVRDDQDNELYVCTMETLGCEPVDLMEGETLKVQFRFVANLVPGTYSIGSVVHGRLHDSVVRTTIDRTFNKLQLPVTGECDARGSANLFASCETSHDLAEPNFDPCALIAEP